MSGIDKIGGAGALNVSSNQSRQRNTEIHVSEAASSKNINKQDVAVVAAAESKRDAQSESNNKEKEGYVQGEITTEKVKAAVDDINKQIKQNVRHTQCSFKYHEETNRISITVKDSDTDEVIKEIPPEKALDMLAKAWELAGLMVDEKR